MTSRRPNFLFLSFLFILLFSFVLPSLHAGQKWSFRSPSPFVGSPVVGSSYVYALTESGQVYLLDSVSGGQGSPYSLGASASVGPVADGPAVLLASDAGVVEALELERGRRMWRYLPLRAPDGQAPSSRDANYNITLRGLAAGGGMAYVVYSNQTIAINISSGVVRWVRPLGAGGGSAGADEERAYVMDGPILKAFARDGTLLWSRETGPLFHTRPVSDRAGRLYVATTKGFVLSLDAASGYVFWAAPVNGWPMSSPLPAGSSIIFGDNEGHVRAVRTATGEPLWSADAGGAVWSEPVLISQGERSLVAVGTHANSIVALNPATGSLLWRYPAGDWVDALSAGHDGSTLLAHSRDGTLLALLVSPMCTIDKPHDNQLIPPYLQLQGRAWAWAGARRVQLSAGGAPALAINLPGSGPWNKTLDLTALPDGPVPIQCLAEDAAGLQESDAAPAKSTPVKSFSAPRANLSLTVPEVVEPGQRFIAYVRNADGFDLSDVLLEYAGLNRSISSPANLTAPQADGTYVLTARKDGFSSASAKMSARANWGPYFFGALVLLVLLGLLAYVVLRKKPVRAPGDYKL